MDSYVSLNVQNCDLGELVHKPNSKLTDLTASYLEFEASDEGEKSERIAAGSALDSDYSLALVADDPHELHSSV